MLWLITPFPIKLGKMGINRSINPPFSDTSMHLRAAAGTRSGGWPSRPQRRARHLVGEPPASTKWCRKRTHATNIRKSHGSQGTQPDKMIQNAGFKDTPFPAAQHAHRCRKMCTLAALRSQGSPGRTPKPSSLGISPSTFMGDCDKLLPIALSFSLKIWSESPELWTKTDTWMKLRWNLGIRLLNILET